MSEEPRTKAALAAELAALRQRVAELEANAAEAGLRDRSDLLRFIFDHTYDGISIYEEQLDSDAPRKLLDCNERYAELAGRTKAELLAIGDTRSVQLPFAPRSGREAVAVLASGRPFRGRFSWIRPDGRENVLEYVAVPQHRGGRIVTVGVDRDVTEQIRWEKALRTSERRFRGTFDRAAVGIANVALDGTYLRVNRRFCEIVGYPAEELLTRRFHDVTHPDDLAADFARVERMLAGEIETGVTEKRYVRKDGSVVWGRMTVSLQRDEAGRPEHFVVVLEDVTARKQAEEALRDSEERFRAIFEEAADSVVLLAARTGAFVEFNNQAHENLGYTREEFARLSLADIEARESPADASAHLAKVLRDSTDQFETKQRTKAGEIRDIHVNTRRLSIRGQDFLLGVWRDITESQRAAEALRESEERYRSVYETAPLAFVLWDRECRVTDWNRQAEEVFGWTRDDVLGQNFFGFLVPQAARPQVQEVVSQLLQGRLPSHSVNENLTKSGRTVTCEWSNAVLRDSRGQVVGAISLGLDITERRRVEAERRELEAKVQESARLEGLGLLAGGIAHDFNNLLMGILGNADLALADLPPHSPARESLHDITTAGRRAADLCKQLLAYAGKGRFVVACLDLNDLVQETTRLLELSISKKATLRFHLAPGLPSIEADPTQVRQVLMNLITNASEALGDRGGVISIATRVAECRRADLAAAHPAAAHLAADLPEGPYVVLEVADTGCGMDRETLDRIFDPFFSTKFIGRGLGLAAVLGIARGHQGTVQVHSEPGRGTTFQVLFPAVAAPASPLADAPREADVPGSGRTILLVDDEETVRLVAQRMLARVGFQVLAAADGAQAIALFRQHAADVACVVLDLTMPHMDGDETFRELRRIRPDIPVILSSGYNEQDVAERFAGKGLAGFVQKPYRMSDLRAALRAVLGGP